MNFSKVRLVAAHAVAAIIPTLTLVAQERADPIAIGTARTTVGSARGLSSLYSNVGGLALDALGSNSGEPSVEVDLALAPIGISAGSTYLNSSELNFVFDDKACAVFSDADRMRLGGLLERDRLAADAAFDIAALRIRIPGLGAIGVQYGHRIRVRMNFPEEFRQDMLGTGDVFARSNRYDGTDIGGEWQKRLALTLGTAWERVDVSDEGDTWLPTIGFGASVSALEGVVHFDVDPTSFINTQTLTRSEQGTRRIAVSGRYAFRSSVPDNFKPSEAILRPGFGDVDSSRATGYGTSLGVSAVILCRVRIDEELTTGSPLDPEATLRHTSVRRDAITVGITVDEIGSLAWEGTNLRRSRRIDTVVTDERGGLTYDMLCGYSGDLDTVGSFTTYLPAQLRFGGSIDITAFVPGIAGDLIAGVEAAFDLNNAIGQEPSRLSIGAQWRPWAALTMMSGMQVGGRQGFAWSVGADLHPFRWLSIAAATSDWTALLASGTEEYDVTIRVGTHFKF